MVAEITFGIPSGRGTLLEMDIPPIRESSRSRRSSKVWLVEHPKKYFAWFRGHLMPELCTVSFHTGVTPSMVTSRPVLTPDKCRTAGTS